MDEELNPSTDGSISRVLSDFVDNINGLSETIDLIMFALLAIKEHGQENIDRFEGEHGELEEVKGHTKTIKFGLREGFEYIRMLKRHKKYQNVDRLIPRSLMISLISQYDVFLGKLIHVLALLHPKSLNFADRSITFSQLQTFGSIDSALEYLTDKEIDTVLRMSHSEQFDWLEEKYNLPLRKNLKIWPIFIEATERRNLFVHTGGVVSRQYLNVCKEHNVDLPKDIALDDELHVTNEYFQAVYECIFELGVGLAHVLWRKLLPDDREKADANLNEISYDLLVDEKYRLACRLLDFATKIPTKYSSDRARRMFIINRAQAYKWAGEQKIAVKIINGEDWSATNASFRLAKAVILDNFEEADKIVREIGATGEIDELAYREWPLFREYRKSEGFLNTFHDVFGEPFHFIAVEASTDENSSEAASQVDVILAEKQN